MAASRNPVVFMMRIWLLRTFAFSSTTSKREVKFSRLIRIRCRQRIADMLSMLVDKIIRAHLLAGQIALLYRPTQRRVPATQASIRTPSDGGILTDDGCQAFDQT